MAKHGCDENRIIHRIWDFAVLSRPEGLVQRPHRGDQGSSEPRRFLSPLDPENISEQSHVETEANQTG
jgi:hypothetical protein